MEQTEFKFCNYPGGCQNEPSLKDEVHGGSYCKQHAFSCDECMSIHGKQEMVEFVVGKYNETKSKLCADCSSSHMICPNCKLLILNDDFLPPTNDNFTLKKGGCTECAANCTYCQKVIDKDNAYKYGSEFMCEECYGENFAYCDNCGDNWIANEDMVWIEDTDITMCSSCYKENYTRCYECDKVIEKNDAEEYKNEEYCDTCIKKVKQEEYSKYTEKLQNFTYTSKDRYLSQLEKLLPISIKKLKSQHPSMAAGLNDLISFSKGQDLTNDIIYNYRVSLDPENFPVKYTTWDGLQRSTDRLVNSPDNEQLVLIVEAGKKMSQQLNENGPLIWLFESINNVSEKSGHPSTPQQIGWVRLELDPNGEYILVDEIQSDHLNAAYSLKNERNVDMDKIRETIKSNFDLDDNQFKSILNEYYVVLKDFPKIANQAITKFARENGFKKIFWHTYEGGKELKNNNPPKSLYTKVPKEHFYQESNTTPFNLPGKFFEREARINIWKLIKKVNHAERRQRSMANN